MSQLDTVWYTPPERGLRGKATSPLSCTITLSRLVVYDLVPSSRHSHEERASDGSPINVLDRSACYPCPLGVDFYRTTPQHDPAAREPSVRFTAAHISGTRAKQRRRCSP